MKKIQVGVLPPKRPNNITEVDNNLRLMDIKYRTSFYQFLQDSRNLDRVAMYCKRVIHDLSCDELAIGISWLTKDYNVAKTAEMLIKMFYNMGFGHVKFAETVHGVSKKFESLKDRQDLVLTLLIGEDAKIASLFMGNYTKCSELNEVKGMIIYLATELKWDGSFMMNFILGFSKTLYERNRFTNEDVLVNRIKRLFSALTRLFHENGETLSPDLLSNTKQEGTTRALFAILDLVIDDLHEKISARDYPNCFPKGEKLSPLSPGSTKSIDIQNAGNPDFCRSRR